MVINGTYLVSEFGRKVDNGQIMIHDGKPVQHPQRDAKPNR